MLGGKQDIRSSQPGGSSHKGRSAKNRTTNIHTEIVSRNSIKIDGIPPLTEPYRKLQTAGMHIHGKAFG